ncbi:MAG: class II aldolase/adducin family protein [Firmicutes bacterium]|nr:class II aldolase/adducin family protein [Bacillota bacterium]
MKSEFELKKDICEVGRRIYTNGFVAANDGNISVRINDKEVLTTPTGVSKGFMTSDMIVKVDMDGNVISGKLKPSSELKMHLDVYKNREDVKSVVHAHPPTATGFAVAGIPLNEMIMPEVIISLGTVPIAKYGTPSTMEIPEAVRKYLDCYDGFLLENHGALTVGTDLFNAYFKMETIELAAKINLTARQLGGVKEISPENVDRLYEIRKKLGVQGNHPANCAEGELVGSQSKRNNISEDELAGLVAEITKKVMTEVSS